MKHFAWWTGRGTLLAIAGAAACVQPRELPEGAAPGGVLVPPPGPSADARPDEPNVVPDAASPPARPDGRAPTADAAVARDQTADTAGTAPASDAAAPDLGVTRPEDAAATACLTIADCPRGFNCEDRQCTAAAGSCQDERRVHPAAADGVYWIRPNGVLLRAYCDMHESIELCTEIESEHRGVTRESSRLAFRMTSVLDADRGVCKLWALRSVPGDYPIGQLVLSDPPRILDACLLLGFTGEQDVALCPFGSDPGNSDCGFATSQLLRWGSTCAVCQQGNGNFDHYVLQGPSHASHVIGNASGTLAALCRVR